MFISPATKGLSNRLLFFGCTIIQQFNIKGPYQQTLIQLDKSIIIQQSNKKGPNQRQTLMLLDTFIVIHHFRCSKPHQQKTLILLKNLFSSPVVQSEKPPIENTSLPGRIITSQVLIYPFTKYKILK